jgi:hypothetical protein
MIRETIIRRLVARDLAGTSLLEESVRADDELLHAAALSEFGTWQTALEYAGVNTRDVERGQSLSVKQTKQQLRRLCTTGYDLGAHVNRSRNPMLHDAAIKHFGSWREALRAAGINLANVSRRRYKHLDRDLMILWLQHRNSNGLSLRWTVVCLENRDYALAIRRTFRSWREAIAAAEIGCEGRTPD